MRKLILVLFLFAICSPAQSQPKYTLQEIGSLPGLPNCAATAISQSGSVAGYCFESAAATSTRGFLYANGVMKDLGASSQAIVIPLAVNDSGTIVGTFVRGTLTAPTFSGPFLYQNGAYQTTGYMQSVASPTSLFMPFGLTNSGQVSGVALPANASFDTFNSALAYLVPAAGGLATTLQPPSGIQYAGAVSESANGEWVAGGASGRNMHVVPIVWRKGTVQRLPLVSGFQSQIAVAVNDSGTVIGPAFNIDDTVGYDDNGSAHAVIFSGAAATDLGVLPGDKISLPTGINNSGQIVGFSSAAAANLLLELAALFQPPSAMHHPFLYTGGKMYDVSKLVTNGTGWTLSYAVGITGTGVIAGTGSYQGRTRAYLLTPVAPPAITSIRGAGLSVPAVSNLAPNGLVTIFGAGFAAAGLQRILAPADLNGSALPTKLDGVCVQAGASRWGLTYVSATQINALTGELPASGTIAIKVLANCGTAEETATAEFVAPVAPVAPEFLYFVQNTNGQNPVAAIQAVTGAYVGAPGLISGADFAPAKVNDLLTVFAVGLGATDPPVPYGNTAPAAAVLTGDYRLTIGGIPAQVLYAGVTPTFAGLYQLNFVVPPGIAAGNQPIALTLNGVSSSAGAFITIAQ